MAQRLAASDKSKEKGERQLDVKLYPGFTVPASGGLLSAAGVAVSSLGGMSYCRGLIIPHYPTICWINPGSMTGARVRLWGTEAEPTGIFWDSILPLLLLLL